MKDLRFQRCLLVSHKERAGRDVEFHPNATVLKGSNDTGKSSIVKSLYQALGAEPAIEHPRWKGADVVTLLYFTVDGEPYRAFRAGRTYALFRNDQMIGRYDSVTTGIGPQLASLLNFRLKLTDREGKVVVPPPAYMFLPFYCDQDAGWNELWSSFARLSQFANWRREVISFHAGMRSGDYYVAQEKAAHAIKERERPVSDRAALLQLSRKPELDEDLDAEIDVDAFKAEIDELVRAHAKLADEREKYRQRLQALNVRLHQLSAQKEILVKVRNELHSDYEYSVDALDGHVECPTCGTMHSNSFAERFAIAQDEAKAADLLLTIGGRAPRTQPNRERESPI